MGKRGPKPKPTTLRVFEGNPSHRPLNENEPKPANGLSIPEPPEWLGDIGKAKWREIAPTLFAVGCLTLADLDLFGAYCEAHDEFHSARETIEREGLIATSAKGAVYQHPAVGVKNRAIARIRQFGNDFGMSPAARSGLKVGGSELEDDLETFRRA